VILPDVNVLIYAFREDAVDHADYRSWLMSVVESPEAFALSELVLSGVVRVLTHPRVFNPPTPLDKALAYVNALRAQPNAVIIAPDERHWDIFHDLSVAVNCKGNLLADAYHAALAIEHGCEWITTDNDFTRFKGLRWRHPLHRRR
jgi:toxin-antitoxin system PIN domain toxin